MVSYLAIFLGVAARTIIPYLIKLKKKPNLKWENKYLISAIAGLLITAIISVVVAGQMATGLTPMGEFCAAFTLQSLSREIHKMLA